MQYSQTQNNTYTKTNLSTVKWAQWDKTQSRELLGLFICVCSSLCTIVVHNTAQDRADNFPSCPAVNHHWSDDVYLRERGARTARVLMLEIWCKGRAPLPSGVLWWMKKGWSLVGLVLCVSFSALTLLVGWQEGYISLVFCCYQQAYDIFNMSCLGVILQVRGRDGISTPQNGAAAYSQSHSLTYLPGWFPIAFPAIFVFLSVFLLWYVLPNCRGFPLTSLPLASSQLLMQTLHAWLARCYQVTHTAAPW